MKKIFLTYSFLLCCAILHGASSEVKLKMTSSFSRGNGIATVKLNKKGMGELLFANSKGKILIKYTKSQCFVDKNNDGKFEGDDAKPIKYNSVFSVPVIYKKTKYEYEMKIPIATKKKVFIMGGSCLQGKYKGSQVTLFDRNVNGDFSENGIDKIQFNKDIPTLIAGVVFIKKKMFSTEYKEKGTIVRFTKNNAPIVKIKVTTPNDRLVNMHISNVNGKFSTPLKSGEEVYAILGEYEILKITTIGKPTKKMPRGCNAIAGAGGLVVLKKGINTITIKGPYKLNFKAVKVTNDELKITFIAFEGSYGAIYNPRIGLPDKKRGKGVFSCWIRSGKKEKEVTKLKYS